MKRWIRGLWALGVLGAMGAALSGCEENCAGSLSAVACEPEDASALEDGAAEVGDGDVFDGSSDAGFDYQAGGMVASGGTLSGVGSGPGAASYVAYTATAPALMSAGLMTGGDYAVLAGSPYAAGVLGGEMALGGQCGDGVVGVGEACDPPDQAVACADLSLGAGEALCLADCQLDVSGCEGGSGALRKVAVAQGHACALDDLGQITCWGANLSGQSAPPALPAGQLFSDVFVGDAVGSDGAPAGGEGFSCGLIRAAQQPSEPGDLECWGALTPISVLNAMPRVHALAIGPEVACYVDGARNLRCVSLLEGLAVPEDFLSAARTVAGPGDPVGAGAADLSSLSLGRVFEQPRLCALNNAAPLASGLTPVCWTLDLTVPTAAPIGVYEPDLAELFPNGLDQLDVGRDLVCGVDTRGALACEGDAQMRAATPAQGAFTAVSTGATSACAITDASELVCWSGSGAGALELWSAGLSGAALRFEALEMAPPSPGADGDVACAVVVGGETVKCEAAAPSLYSVERPMLYPYLDVALSGNSSAAPLICAAEAETGRLDCFGEWLGTAASQLTMPPSDVDRIALSDTNACVVRRSTGLPRCWRLPDAQGSTGAFGALGPTFTRAVDVKTSDMLACALDANGTLYCGTHDTMPLPEGLSAETTGVTDFAVGWDTICYTATDGSLSCFGTQSLGVAEAEQVALSDAGACAIQGGDVHCATWWSQDFNTGTMGQGAYNRVWMGYDAVCARRADDGALDCWGAPESQALVTAPARRFSEVVIGLNAICGVVEDDGTLMCWGAQARNLPPRPGGP